jgi:DNA-binding XRE family transcriptional regulator
VSLDHAETWFFLSGNPEMGARLRKIRSDRGLSQDDVAARLDGAGLGTIITLRRESDWPRMCAEMCFSLSLTVVQEDL